VLVGVLLLGFVGVYAFVSTGNSISEREASVTALEQELASSTARAGALQSFSSFATLEQARTQTVTALAQSRFDWERVLRELALVIPADVSLLTLSGSVTGDAASSGSDSNASGESIEAPTLVMSGCATDQESVARMLSALRDIDGVTRVGLTKSSRGDSSSAGGAGSGGCANPGDFTFDLTVAFDEVTLDPATGGVAPPLETEPTPGDASGIPEVTQGRERARGAVESAQDQSQKAVENFVPGA
jgi:Tfp pilus assembly protein PilN